MGMAWGSDLPCDLSVLEMAPYCVYEADGILIARADVDEQDSLVVKIGESCLCSRPLRQFERPGINEYEAWLAEFNVREACDWFMKNVGNGVVEHTETDIFDFVSFK